MADPYGFLGRGWKFPLQIDKKTGHIAMVSYEEDIKESIGIILNTYLGERVMRADFGTNVADFVFDPLNQLTIQNVSGSLETLLQTQEPRVRDVTVETEGSNDPFTGRIVFNISYTVRSTNNRYNHVYPFYMDEGNQEESII